MICPSIHLVQVPVARGKADLNLYRDAGSEVCLENNMPSFNLLCTKTIYCACFEVIHKVSFQWLPQVVSILSTKGRCERASIDEVYLDLTDAAEVMLSEAPPEVLETIDEEVLKSHVLGLDVVRQCTIVSLFSLFLVHEFEYISFC